MNPQIRKSASQILLALLAIVILGPLAMPSARAASDSRSLVSVIRLLLDEDQATGLLSKLVINELDYDQPGQDTAEYVEIYNNQDLAVSLTGVSLVMINGSTGVSYNAVELDSLVELAPFAYAVIGNTSVTASLPAGVKSIDLVTNTVQNGSPDGVMLLNRADDLLIDALSYEGEITAATVDLGDGQGVRGPFNLVAGIATTEVDANASAVSLGRFPNGSDSGDDMTDWRALTSPTPGIDNVSSGDVARLVINELDYDQPGSDIAEFIEVYNNQNQAVSLTGVSLVMINGSTGVSYNAVELDSLVELAPFAYAVIGNTSVTASLPAGVKSIGLSTSFVQNGSPDGVMLLNRADDLLIDALSYEGEITAATVDLGDGQGVRGPFNLVAGIATVTADLSSPGSVGRLPNGTDTHNDVFDWALLPVVTPGLANVVP